MAKLEAEKKSGTTNQILKARSINQLLARSKRSQPHGLICSFLGGWGVLDRLIDTIDGRKNGILKISLEI